jgi:hypothetical protein
MNPFEVLLWFTETLHIENWGQLEVWLVMLDLYAHFVTFMGTVCVIASTLLAGLRLGDTLSD